MKKSNTLKTIYQIAKIGSSSFVVSLIGVILCSLANYGLSLVIGLFSQAGLDQVSSKIFEPKQLIIIFILALILLPINLLGQTMNLTGGLNSEKRLKEKIVMHSLYEKTADISSEHSAKIMTLLTSDSSVVDNFYFQGLNHMFLNPLLSGMAALITTFVVDYRFGIVSIVFGLLTILVSFYFTDKTQKAYNDAREKDQASITAVSEIISNEMMIRQYAIEDKLISEYTSKNIEYKAAVIKAKRISNFITMNHSAFNMLSLLTFLILGFYLTMYKDFQFSSLMLLLPLRSSIAWMFLSFGSSYSFLLEVSISANRILDFLNSDVEDQKEQFPQIEVKSCPNILTFESIDFAYGDKKILSNFNLSVQENTSVAFVGKSGSGKSTLFKLLLGLLDNYTGVIKMYDQDIKKVSLESLRSLVVSVEQEAPLFNKSIYENIALGSSDYNNVTKDMVVKAAKSAGIHDFVNGLPDKYNTKVGEAASNISGGQKQRIAIARALMSSAPIIIMDEPTSSLDNESEILITNAIKNISKEKTVIITAHRLSTVKDLDCIVVLDEGKIKEKGSHTELMQLNGLYKEFLLNQKENENV